MLAKSPTRPSTPEAPTASLPSPPLRLLPCGANSSRAGLSPAVNQRLSRRTCNGDFSPIVDEIVSKIASSNFASQIVQVFGTFGTGTTPEELQSIFLCLAKYQHSIAVPYAAVLVMNE